MSKPKNQNHFLLGVAVVIGAIFIGVAAYMGLFANPTLSNKPKVAATIFPIYDITKQIAGGSVDTVLVLPPGASPHTFDPTPMEVKQIAGSKAIFAIGYGLDNWSNKIANAAGVSNVITVDKNIKVYDNNPHYWLSPKNAKLIAGQVKDDLSSLFPSYSNEFESNYQVYIMMLTELDKQYSVTTNDFHTKSIATFHDAFSYLARDYNLKVVTTFEEFPGKEPTPTYLSEFSNKIKQSRVPVIFSEPEFSTDQLKPVANDLGVKIDILDPLGGTKNREDYIKLMLFNLDQLTKYLQ